jgi:hypothetical protein
MKQVKILFFHYFFPSPFSLLLSPLLTPHLPSFYFFLLNSFLIAVLIGFFFLGCVCVCVFIGVTLFNKVHAKASHHMAKLHGKTSQSNLQYPCESQNIHCLFGSILQYLYPFPFLYLDDKY